MNHEEEGILKRRLEYLTQIRPQAGSGEGAPYPEGTLRIARKGHRFQYYHRTDPSDLNGIYIPVRDVNLARGLAQKDYDRRARQAVDQEIKAIQKYLNNTPDITVEEVYENLNEARRELVIPAIDTDEMLISRWKQVQYRGKPFGPDDPVLFTAGGLRVRSRIELIIANYLDQEGIPYRYEWPVQLWNGRIVYPDFLILNVRKRKEVIFEHFGMMDDPGYAEVFVAKINDYQMSGYYQGVNLVMTWETRERPLDMRLLKTISDQYFK